MTEQSSVIDYELIEYVNDVNRQYTEVLMKLNENGYLDTAYTYGNERLSADRFEGSSYLNYIDPSGNRISSFYTKVNSWTKNKVIVPINQKIIDTVNSLPSLRVSDGIYDLEVKFEIAEGKSETDLCSTLHQIGSFTLGFEKSANAINILPAVSDIHKYLNTALSNSLRVNRNAYETGYAVGELYKIMLRRVVMNFIKNSKMKELYECIKQENSKEILSLELKNLEKLIHPNLLVVKDCIIICNQKIKIKDLEENFEHVVEPYGDRTGYEASNNEIQLNYYFENTISDEMGIRIAILLIEVWTPQIKMLDKDAQIFFMIFCSEDGVELRFHKIHDGEPMWIDMDIDSYSEAVGYLIV